MQITIRPTSTLTVSWLTRRNLTAGVTYPVSGDLIAQPPSTGESVEDTKHNLPTWSQSRATLSRRIQEHTATLPIPPAPLDPWEQMPLFEPEHYQGMWHTPSGNTYDKNGNEE